MQTIAKLIQIKGQKVFHLYFTSMYVRVAINKIAYVSGTLFKRRKQSNIVFVGHNLSWQYNERSHKLGCRNRNVYLVRWTYVTYVQRPNTGNKLRISCYYIMQTNTLLLIHFKNRSTKKWTKQKQKFFFVQLLFVDLAFYWCFPL